ncbi:hypothetical protein NCS57_01086500 [Fusarium keratoplasticum]|uniref:Uncharacterized protein n=1 Tax=Fusarium keratoplasticum TaxID=1328300 RepID=A0ACC0QR98_9HYPO|nr:hypothetical protein NCS57_01086500 [Fusarium keratoplasticum]KAI8661071.1 hypothetical protein NCS57_01086500 [Fusarium keratoplasticum]KAI8662079.1 hypothetical protein NCS55_01080500 [Fusarium keratoplasticum]
MANTSEPTCSSSALGKWVEDLYDRIFCQPNDEVSASAFKERVSEGFTARINHDLFSRQTFMEAIMKFRVDNMTSIQSIREIQFWDAPDGSGAGCVSQLVHFTDSNKETGVGTKSSTLLIASIKVVNGQKVLVDLTEVLKVSE